jgi:hypothetical protein
MPWGALKREHSGVAGILCVKDLADRRDRQMDAHRLFDIDRLRIEQSLL